MGWKGPAHYLLLPVHLASFKFFRYKCKYVKHLENTNELVTVVNLWGRAGIRSGCQGRFCLLWKVCIFFFPLQRMCSSSTCVMQIAFHHVIFFKKQETDPAPYISVTCLGAISTPISHTLPGRLSAQQCKAVGSATQILFQY